MTDVQLARLLAEDHRISADLIDAWIEAQQVSAPPEPIPPDAPEPANPIVTDPSPAFPPVGADGWTPFPESTDDLTAIVRTQVGLSGIVGAATPGDRIGLQRGGTWPACRVPAGVMLVAYGDPADPRPVIRPDAAGEGILLGRAGQLLHVDLQGEGHGAGVLFGSDTLIEGCNVRGWNDNLDGRDSTGAVIRRSTILDAINQGIWLNNTNRLRVEESIFDNNGWIAHQHAVYAHTAADVVWWQCLFAHSYLYDWKARGPGLVNWLIERCMSWRTADPFVTQTEDEENERIGDWQTRGLTIRNSTFLEYAQHFGINLEHVIRADISGNTFIAGKTDGYHAPIVIGGDMAEHIAIVDNRLIDPRGNGIVCATKAEPVGLTITGNRVYVGKRCLKGRFGSTAEIHDNVYHSTGDAANWFNVDSLKQSFEQWGEPGAEKMPWPDPIDHLTMDDVTLNRLRMRRWGSWLTGCWEA